MGIGDIMDEIVKQMGENTAMNCTYVGTTEQTLGSTDYQCAEFDVDISGMTIKQYILVNKFMNYTTNITITAMASEPIEEFLPMFTSGSGRDGRLLRLKVKILYYMVRQHRANGACL